MHIAPANHMGNDVHRPNERRSQLTHLHRLTHNHSPDFADTSMQVSTSPVYTQKHIAPLETHIPPPGGEHGQNVRSRQPQEWSRTSFSHGNRNPKSQHKPRGPSPTYKLLHSTGSQQQNTKTTSTVGDKRFKRGNAQWLHLEDVHTTYTTRQRKSRPPNGHVRKRPEDTFLQGRHADGQQAHETMLNVPGY